MPPEPPQLALERVRQVFRFLKAFAERNSSLQRRLNDQPWSLRLADLPTHPSIAVGEVHLARPGEAHLGGEETVDGAPLLRVRRPEITRAVPPPVSLHDWMQPGWENPSGEIQVVRERNSRRGVETITEFFDEDSARVQALSEWRARWDRWAMAERPAREAMRIFERLYELQGRIALESERVELMLGDGRLRWRTAAGDTDHPVLLQRVELQFDPEVPEIRLVDADRIPELYGAILNDEHGVSAETFSRLREELESAGYHPLSGEATSVYLKRLVQLVSPRGEFKENAGTIAAGTDPVVSRDPALFLRARVTGFSAAFERVLEDLEHREEVPVALARLVGVTPPAVDREPPPIRSPWGEPPDVLLSKPANKEQIEIARALARHHAVLVQGPPGTGKSHTIANLIGHLVAQGNRVLVTSHTTKALRVLRAQLVETLQPLCVAVLEHDNEARAQMEQSVRGILSRLTTAHEETMEREVVTFTEERASLNALIDELTGDLRDAREAEYRPIAIAGEVVTPSDAARWVRDNAEGNEWILGRVEAGAPLPIDPEELAELYASGARISKAEEEEIDEGLPDLELVPDPAEFQSLVTALRASEAAELARFWSRPASPDDLLKLEQLSIVVSQAAQDLAVFVPWQRLIVAAGYGGGVERELWSGLRRQVDEAVTQWENSRTAILDYEPTITYRQSQEETRQCLSDIVIHLESGGSLNAIKLLLNPTWKAVIQASRVNGTPPETLREFQALGFQAALEAERRKLKVRWSRQAEPIGLPAFDACGSPPEPALREYAAQFDSLLDWWQACWRTIEIALGGAGFRWDDFRKQDVARTSPVSPFERDAELIAEWLAAVIATRLAVVRRQVALATLGRLERVVEAHRGPVCATLLQAIRARKPIEYERARSALLDMVAKVGIWKRRTELLQRLELVAPDWARAIRNRDGLHGAPRVPGEPKVAWRFRQLRQESDRRAALDEIRLIGRLHQTRGELRDVTARLIDRRAWLGQLRRTDLPARQALQGWADTQKRIGRGTGKRVPALQARARELLAKAREAVPVWIMPLNRVAESFDPRAGRFDVVIVDEASQSDVTGLLCWYLGNRVAVVGDHEQVSPLAVGQQIAPVQALINEHLGGIPNSHLYDGRMSIYHLARQCFGGTIALREHFRCVPDIIEFSNRLSYNGEIQPLRNPETAARPHVVEYVVDSATGADRSGKSNLTEARTISALIKAGCELPEYHGKTMGAITLLGDEQAGLIYDLTVGLVGAVDLDHRRFVAGNASQFQGDERDIVFLSMVDVPAESPLPLRSTDVFKQRYNVAASRAKDQLWLVHSLDPDRDLKPGDLRRALIEHARDPSAKRRAVEVAQRRAESPFEAAVIERLINADYRVEAQVWVGRYRIDMVVSDGGREVALECDGDRHHGLDEIPEDLARQAILERAGWRFVRVRGTRFFRDPEGTTAWIVTELARLGVQPVGPALEEQAQDAASIASRERVVRRAHEIMRAQGWLRTVQPPSSAASTI